MLHLSGIGTRGELHLSLASGDSSGLRVTQNHMLQTKIRPIVLSNVIKKYAEGSLPDPWVQCVSGIKLGEVMSKMEPFFFLR